MSREPVLVALAALGLVVTAAGFAIGRRRGRSSAGVSALLWVGLALFGVCGVQALDAAALSARGRGLWLSGVVTAGALGLAALAARSDQRAVRVTALVAGGVFAVLFVLLLVFDVDPLGALT